MTDAEKRQHFFDRGVAALDAIGRSPQGRYRCPQCIRWFAADALDKKVLSLEHVPPESVGGTAITLTCVDCNNTAGGGPEGQMARRQQVEAFLLGHGEEAMRLSMGGHEVQVFVKRGPTGMVVRGREKQTDPAEQRGWEEYLERGGHIGDTFKLQMPWFDARAAAVADLRAAYLAVFAKLGYSYILKPALAAVHVQLDQPNARVLKLIRMQRPGSAPDTRAIVICHEPVQCLWVQIGQRAVVLPWPPSGVDPYEEIPRRFPSSENVTWTGREVRWPTGMEMWWDFGGESVLADLAPPVAPPG